MTEELVLRVTRLLADKPQFWSTMSVAFELGVSSRRALVALTDAADQGWVRKAWRAEWDLSEFAPAYWRATFKGCRVVVAAMNA